MIQDGKIIDITCFPPSEILNCNMSMTTLETDPCEIILNHDQIHLEPLHQTHDSIRPQTGIKICISYKN